MARNSTVQNAIRLLFIFVNGAEPLSDHLDGYVAVFNSKTKLHAIDFWVRYPDFLAFELLNCYEETNDDYFLQTARKILDDKEPDLRTIPMIRYKFGAYEDLNETMSLLVAKGLIDQKGTRTDDKIQEYQYFITQLAKQIVNDCTNEFPILKWYDERAKLVIRVAGPSGGTALKAKQYKHLEYAQTRLGTVIPSIKQEVMTRLKKFE